MFLEPEEIEIDADTVRAALSNSCDRRILALAQERPIAAKTILEQTAIPKSTLYRRIDRLEDQGLLRVVASTIEHGHRIDRYRCPLSHLVLRVADGDVHVGWTVREARTAGRP